MFLSLANCDADRYITVRLDRSDLSPPSPTADLFRVAKTSDAFNDSLTFTSMYVLRTHCTVQYYIHPPPKEKGQE